MYVYELINICDKEELYQNFVNMCDGVHEKTNDDFMLLLQKVASIEPNISDSMRVYVSKKREVNGSVFYDVYGQSDEKPETLWALEASLWNNILGYKIAEETLQKYNNPAERYAALAKMPILLKELHTRGE